MSKNLLLVVSIAIVIVVGPGSFFAGLQYGKTSGNQSLKLGFDASNMDRTSREGLRANMPNGTRGGAGFVSGEIIAQDSQCLTLKLQDNGSKIVFFSTSTQISKFDQGDLSDLALGKTVMVNGKENSDGAIFAQTIQIRPALPQTGLSK